jgi:hypothetical protein
MSLDAERKKREPPNGEGLIDPDHLNQL